MCFENKTCVEQSEPVSFNLLAFGAVSAVIAFENMLQVLCRDAGTIVPYADLHLSAVRFGTVDADSGVVAGIFDGIVNQVLEYSREKVIVACNSRMFRLEYGLDMQLLVCLQVPCHGVGQALQQLVDIDGLQVEFDSSLVGRLQ